jgi:aldehyde:ferredoxin oxidoreductase
MGGYFGAELKYAGYDGIIIHGQADAPCYLLIEDDHVFLEDARDLWGQGVYATEQVLKARHTPQHQVAAIGPAGENRVRFASIIHRLNNAVGNGGFGGVMGAKNLKAIVVRGTGGVSIADPQGFLDAVRYVWQLAKGGIARVGQPDAGYPVVACTHACSVRCYTRTMPIADRYETSSKQIMLTCVDGSWAGGRRGSYKAYEGTSPRGEKLSIPGAPGFGRDLGLDLAGLTGDVGITGWTHSTWGHYFAALKELGINEIEGEPLDIDKAEWWRDWILRLAHREGLGNDYAEGLARFYDKHQVGPRYLAEFFESAGSRGQGWHREGRLMEAHPSPYWEYSALLYAVSTRDVTPSTHGFFFLNPLYGYPKAPKDPSEISEPLQELAEKLYGSRKAIYPGDEYIEHVTAWHQHRAIIKDSMSVCDWVFPIMRRGYETEEEAKADKGPIYGDTSAEARLYRPCTGIDMSIAEMESPIAERIINLERCLDIRNTGRCRDVDEMVIPHYQWPEKTDGTRLSADASEFRALLDRYYDLRGWDRATGWPTRAKLEELGLEEAAEALEALRCAQMVPIGAPGGHQG